jgi:hypothetical protein
MTGHELINSDGIQGKIHTIRGLQVMIDRDLAELYQVEVNWPSTYNPRVRDTSGLEIYR